MENLSIFYNVKMTTIHQIITIVKYYESKLINEIH